MSKDDVIYLARGGETTGPISESDLDRLRKTGRINEYRWIWRSSEGTWEPLDAAPRGAPKKASGGGVTSTYSNVTSIGTATSQRAYILLGNMGENGIWEGRMVRRGALGCEIVMETNRVYPGFPACSKPLVIQVIDAKGGFVTEHAQVVERSGTKLVMEWLTGAQVAPVLPLLKSA